MWVSENQISPIKVYFSLKKQNLGPAPWPSGEVHALRCSGPGFGSWAQTWHHLSGHVEAASHIPQLEGPAAKIYNCVQGGFGETKQKKKKKKERKYQFIQLMGDKLYYSYGSF